VDVTVTVEADGDLIALDQFGCLGLGTVTPRSDGNAYNVSVTFQGAPCGNGTSTVTGVAFLNELGQLYTAGLNASRTNGFIFVGAR
jgi:hypothetical protein